MNRTIRKLFASAAALCLALCAVLPAGGCGSAESAAQEPALSETRIEPEVGDRFVFGHYEQDGDTANGTEPISWRVLAVEDDRALVISEYILDHGKYNNIKERVTWETCDLRQWLNDDFFNAAFSADEQERVLTVTLEHPDNPSADTLGGNPTEDRVFCLSIDDAEQLFASDADRSARSTAYAANKGAWDGHAWWWLRTPGDNYCDAEFIFDDGRISYYGSYAYADLISVRPAMWIAL